jgi:hypothetical protein
MYGHYRKHYVWSLGMAQNLATLCIVIPKQSRPAVFIAYPPSTRGTHFRTLTSHQFRPASQSAYLQAPLTHCI